MQLVFFAALAPGVALLVIAAVLLRRRFGGYALAEAEIDRLTPVFKREAPFNTRWLLCEYSFSPARRKAERAKGRCYLPLAFFLQEGVDGADESAARDAVIWRDRNAGLPALLEGENRHVGAEAIEHALLSRRSGLRIRYAAREPGRNAPDAADLIPKKRVENRASGQ